MTNLPDDLIDPAEARLVRRVRTYTEPAVVPIDPVSIAATVAAKRSRRGSGVGRFGLLLAGAALLAVAAIGGLGFGTTRPPTGVDTSAAPVASAPPSVPPGVGACTPYDVDAVITAWSGAAGHRIATVELRNVGAGPCSVDPLPQPFLADGHGGQLILGEAGAGAPITFAPGDVLQTLVDVANYCGADPAAPVTVAFIEADVALIVATALTPTDVSGVPPCNGPSRPGEIQMHPWTPAKG